MYNDLGGACSRQPCERAPQSAGAGSSRRVDGAAQQQKLFDGQLNAPKNINVRLVRLYVEVVILTFFVLKRRDFISCFLFNLLFYRVVTYKSFIVHIIYGIYKLFVR